MTEDATRKAVDRLKAQALTGEGIAEAPPTKTRIPLSAIVPGGIKLADFVHRTTNDNTCSRCREVIDDADAPLMLFLGPGGNNMLIYCTPCLYGM